MQPALTRTSTRVVTAVATQHGIKHPLIHKPHEFEPTNTAAPQSWLLPVTAVWQVRTSAILRRTESLIERLRLTARRHSCTCWP